MRSISLLKYPGGKTRAIHEFEKYIPRDVTTMYSPFFGGGSFEIYCANKYGLNILANDKFEPLFNFWNCVFNNKEKVFIEVEKLFPITKERFGVYKTQLHKQRGSFKRAALFYALNKSSFNGQFRGFTENHSTASIKNILKFNTSNFTIDNMDFTDFINKIPTNNPDVIVFLDPPYVTNEYYYGWKGNLHKDFDHHSLAKILLSRNNNTKWMLCYNKNKTIKTLYKDCIIKEVSWPYSINRSTKDSFTGDTTEYLIISQALQKSLL